MAHILFTGAGFSHNWGGWLAAEAFEYLLGAAEIDEHLRSELWQTKARGGGFEDTLAALQGAYQTNRSPENKRRLDAMTAALIGMFNAMDEAFARQRLEQDPIKRVRSFLSYFDAIFTLNQDTLLELLYLGSVRWSEKWPGSYLPYMERMDPEPQMYFHPRDAPMTPAKHFTSSPDLQPYYKLHGSYNWFSETERLLVMGGNKFGNIQAFDVLARYHREFAEQLSKPITRLMVIGYSFGDDHINEAIGKAADTGRLRIFIIDPAGVDVLNKQNARAAIRVPEPLVERLSKSIIGASRRPDVHSRQRPSGARQSNEVLSVSDNNDAD